MAYPKVETSVMLDSLFEVFRTHGYEGATLAMLEKYTGLKKASLYHRFPGGKADMAKAVLQAVQDKVQQGIITPLLSDDELPKKLSTMCKSLLEFYAHGRKNCILNVLSIGSTDAEVESLLRELHNSWIDALVTAAVMYGISRREARMKAKHFIIVLEGALVVQRVTGDKKIFQESLNNASKAFLN